MSYELDYESLFTALSKRVERILEEQNEYFELASKATALAPYSKLLGENLFQVSLSDQVKFLKMSVKTAELAKKLCEKYGWDAESEREETM